MSEQDSSREAAGIGNWQNREIGKSGSWSGDRSFDRSGGHRSLSRDARSKGRVRLIGETSVGCVHGRRDARIGTAGRYAVHPLPGIVKFRSAIPADLVGPPANCEQSAEIVVATAEQGRKNPLRQSFHRRWDPRFLKNSRLRQSSATENDRSHERGLPRIAHFHWPLVPIENVCKIDHFGGRGP